MPRHGRTPSGPDRGDGDDRAGPAGDHPDDARAAYDVAATQDKWRPVWDELDPFRARRRRVAEQRYALTMFPYPSGDLHMGHAEVMALHDVIARYWWQRGYDVLNPIGWDSFGLPAENAAIKRDEHPATYTYANIETQAESFRRYGVSFDWSRRLHTSDPEYYRWTQWLFLQFRERGLAYRKFSPGQLVPQRPDRAGQRAGRRRHVRALRRRGHQARAVAVVLQGHRLRPAAAGRHGRRWSRPGPTRVLAMQRNWIGRSEGAHVDFDVEADRTTATRSGSSPPAPTRCSARRSWWSPPTPSWPPRSCAAGAARGAGGLPGRGPQGHRHRPAVHRPAQDRRRPGRHRGQPGHRRADPGVGRRLRAGRLRHRRDHGGARPGPARLGLRRDVRPADRAHRAAPRGLRGRRGEAFTGDGPAINSANDEISLDGLADRRGQGAGSSTGWRRRAPAPAR